MSKGYWNSKSDTAKLMKAFASSFEADEASKKFDAFFGLARDSVELNMAARLIRSVSESAIGFRRAVYNALNMRNGGDGPPISYSCYTIFDNFPLITLGKTPDTVRVFINLPIGPATETDLKEVCWIQFEPLRAFMDSVIVDRGDEKTKQRWETPARSWARIKRYVEMPIGRALNRYTGLPKLFTEGQMSSIATNVHELIKPMKLLFAEKPADYLEMYKAEGVQSCMSANKGHDSLNWTQRLFDHDHHPCSWFAYHPKIRGVYTTRKGKVVARTYLHRSGDREFYGRVYGATPQHIEQFITNLKKEGFDSFKNDKYRYHDLDGIVEIPGLYSKKESLYFCPVPYFDNIGVGITVDFDEKTHAFKFYVGKNDGKHKLHMHNTAGFITNAQVNAPKCARSGCSNMVGPEAVHPTDGPVLCGAECAYKAGYVQARRSDNGFAWVRKVGAFYDKVAGDYFTNLAAAIELGALPLLESLHTDNEDCEEEYTVTGTPVFKDGIYYAYLSDCDLDYWFRKKAVTQEAKPYARKGGKGQTAFRVVEAGRDKIRTYCKTQRNVEIEENEPLVVNV